MNLKFLGAAKVVTGSRTLCHHAGTSVTVDCGLFQGPERLRKMNWQPVNGAAAVDAVVLTHAHLDHSGMLPLFVKNGFEGPIYCSRATAELCHILLLDSAHLQEEDAYFANKAGYSHHRPALPLYTTDDAHRALRMLRPVERGQWHAISTEVSFRLTRSGHILGSSFVELNGSTPNGGRTVLFSGDLGNGRSEILKSPVTGLEADTLILESTYGDRIQPRRPVDDEFAEVITRVMGRSGVLVIPAFSVGRTQEVLHLLRKLEDKGAIPVVPVYLDSPMSTRATEIYLRYPEDHLLSLQNGTLETKLFPQKFTVLNTVEDSKALNHKPGPMVIISAAGMLTGGRVMHHLKQRLPDPANALMFVGYQAVETKGRVLQQGAKELRIHHEIVPVRAEIVSVEGLSAHADQDDLLDWVKKMRTPPKRIFVNHGDGKAPEVLAERLRREIGCEAVAPEQGEEFHLW